jgi:thioredoxin-like negative regulator of GroEL
LQKLIKDTPAVAVDFWSPSCPPCLRIKPVFENLARANDNENLKFATVNTQVCRDCAQAYAITAIPQFYFYHQGKQHSGFKGANEGQLLSTIAELSELVATRVTQHKNFDYQQFKPNNLAPVGFTTMGQLDKMKEFVTKFATSDEAKKDVKNTTNIQNWLNTFKLERMS